MKFKYILFLSQEALETEFVWSAIKGIRYLKYDEDSEVESDGKEIEVNDDLLRNFMAHIGLKHELKRK